ncbi:LORF2 protein, partial [Crocuta crocuta]
TVWRFLNKLNIEVPHDPAIPFLSIYLKELKLESQRDLCIALFTGAFFTTAKTWKQPKCPSADEWIKKIWHLYTMEIPLKKKETMPFATTWLNLEDVMLSEI